MVVELIDEYEMKLSVIIPCFNGADTIADQLEALSEQKWSEPWEIIFSDNGSTDDSCAIAEHYKGRMLNLRIVDASARRGQPYALNQGAQAAKGEALAFADADDIVGPGWVAAMGDALSEHDFVACRWDTEKINPEWTRHYRGNGQLYGPQEIWYPPYLPHAGGGTIGVKRELHEAIGGFDETLLHLHDTDYCWRLQLAGIKLHFVPSAVMYIRFRNGLRSIYRQNRNYAEYNTLLSKRYRSYGDPISHPWQRYLHEWKKLKPSVRLLRGGRGRRAVWVTRLGWQIGRLRGCIKHGVPPV